MTLLIILALYLLWTRGSYEHSFEFRMNISGLKKWELLCADKPPLEELRYFFEFRIPRTWAPVVNQVGSSRKEPVCPSLQFSLMGPKLFISTEQVMQYNRAQIYAVHDTLVLTAELLLRRLMY